MEQNSIKSYGIKATNAMKTWMQIFRTYTKIRTKELNYIQSFGLTMNQFQVLEVLYHKGDLTIGAITKLTMSTPGNITVVVRNLKRDGYVQAVQNEEDKRAFILTITHKGKAIIDELFPQHAKNFEAYFDVLTQDETTQLYAILNKLQKAQ